MHDFITPLSLNHLHGRLLHMPPPAPDAKEVLFVYGHHSSLERWRGIAQLLNQHCAVTMPDLPGFGGMDSLYKIGKTASLNNLADYLADFVTSYYKGRRITIVGMSLGFVIVTRMLQRHPELTQNVEKLISLFGFAHKDDFLISGRKKAFYLGGSRFFALPVTSQMYRAAFANPFVLRHTYHRTPNAREKFKNATPQQHRENMDFEIKLWQQNDMRTYMKTSSEFLTLDNTKVKVDLPVYHISVANDRYFNNQKVQQHFKQIFNEYHSLAELKSGSHAPSRIATLKEAQELIPPQLLKIIA